MDDTEGPDIHIDLEKKILFFIAEKNLGYSKSELQTISERFQELNSFQNIYVNKTLRKYIKRVQDIRRQKNAIRPVGRPPSVGRPSFSPSSIRIETLMAKEACERYPSIGREKAPMTPTISKISDEQKEFMIKNKLSLGKPTYEAFVAKFGPIERSVFKAWTMGMQR